MNILVKLFVGFIFLVLGSAHAQSYDQICAGRNSKGANQCELAPRELAEWKYNHGSSGQIFPTMESAAEGFLNFWKNTPKSFEVCQLSYTVAPVVVANRDGFLLSNKPVVEKSSISLRYGMVHTDGSCIGVGGWMGSPLSGTREAKCGDWNSAYFTDVKSNGCYKNIPSPASTCSRESSSGGGNFGDFSSPGSNNPREGLFGNPIQASTREKIEFTLDLSGSGPNPLEFRRIYRSHRVRDASFWLRDALVNLHRGDLGNGWLHNHDMNLSYTRVADDNTGIFDEVRVQMPDGAFEYFSRKNGGAYVARHSLHSLTSTSVGGGVGWIFQDHEAETQYIFNSNGRLVQKISRNGWTTSYTYDAQGRLSTAQNGFGHSLQFGYDGSGRLSSVVTADSRSVQFNYTGNLLTSIQQVDGTSRQYIYDDVNAPGLLSGVVDENGIRYSTFGYDAERWAVTTEKAGGAERYSIQSVGTSGNLYEARISDPLGTVRRISYQRFNSDYKYYGANLLFDVGERRPKSSISYQDNGLEEYSNDMSGSLDRMTWDATRRLPLSRTEVDNRPALARTTTTSWHPQWRSPATITAPGLTTSFIYDNFGNVLSQAVTDTATGTVRTTAWTYHPSNLVATQTEPNGAVTSYDYDAQGNLTQTTNALGHLNTYTYDGAGRVLTRTAPNGLLATYAYDARGRVLTSNSGGRVSVFTYRPSGQLLTATLPGGHRITYAYDPAHRLTGWSDNRGNTGTYALDGMGNRLSEEVRDSQGQLSWRLARSINNLNQLASLTKGTSESPTTYTYDFQGDLASATQNVGSTVIQTQTPRDYLGRVSQIIDAEYATTALSYNALDGLTKVTDAKSVVTSYTRDANGNPLTETSPDSGSETAQYDALGLPSSITNALGQATTITRDLLGRPTSITHTGGTTTLRYDQTPTSKGYLSEIEDASGTTTYQRDLHGRVISQTQKLINNDTRTLAYSYHATTGLQSSTTYPGGQVLQNVYDATGQLTGLTWAGQPIVSGITWSPLGQPTGWSWSLPGASAAIPATRTYNTAGQLTATEFSSYTYDAAGRITSLTQSLMQPASTDAQASTVTQAPATWTVTYNRAGRITGFTKQVAAGSAANTVTYAYDANGNRTTSSQQRAGTTTNRTYTLTANRQTGFSQTQTGASTANTSVTYGYNAAGDLLTDGLRTFQYDSQERLEKVTTGTGADAPSTQYAHNALGQRVFKTEPLFASGSGGSGSTSGKNLNNLLADPEDQEAEQDKGLIQTAYEFFTRLWSPGSSDAQKLGFAYVYGQDGTLLGEYGMGGSNSTGTTQYIYLPTANGPMPIAAIVNGVAYAVHSDHLNTPRKLTQPDGQVAWQWAYSAFGDEQPTLGAKRFTNETTNPTTGTTTIPEVTFNLRYPGQYYDKESNLHYNYFRSYSAERGRYTQADPIGLDGGFNRFGYVDGDALNEIDPEGLQRRQDPKILRPLEEGGGGGAGGGGRVGGAGKTATQQQISAPRIVKFCESPADSSVWKNMTNYRGNIRTNGEGGKNRNYYQWDHTHGDIEVYNRNGGHLGSMNPHTGDMHKPAVPGRQLNGL